jgi:hypothetical protein
LSRGTIEPQPAHWTTVPLPLPPFDLPRLFLLKGNVHFSSLTLNNIVLHGLLYISALKPKIKSAPAFSSILNIVLPSARNPNFFHEIAKRSFSNHRVSPDKNHSDNKEYDKF